MSTEAAPRELLDVTDPSGRRLTATTTEDGTVRLAVAATGRRGTHSRAVILDPDSTAALAAVLAREVSRARTRARLGLDASSAPDGGAPS